MGIPGDWRNTFNASIGDASILNPILSADSASSEIDNQVFEGLIDRDEFLRFRGRVAQSWEVTEEAFFFVNDAARVSGVQGSEPEAVLRYLEQTRNDPAGTVRTGAKQPSEHSRDRADPSPQLHRHPPPAKMRTRRPPRKSGWRFWRPPGSSSCCGRSTRTFSPIWPKF